MSKPSMVRRQLTLLDVMVLIAAIGIGLTMSKLYNIEYQAPSRYRFLDWMRGIPSCMVAAIALAIVPLRLLQPRPRTQRVYRQPGFVACAAVILGGGVGVILHGVHIVARIFTYGAWPDSLATLFNDLWHGAMMQIPYVVAGVWLSLAITRRWRAEKSWIDLLGQVAGAYWILYILLELSAPGVAMLTGLP